MAALKPIAIYGLEVPADDIAIEADGSVPYPATFRVTMAAIDPSAEVNNDAPKRATLKLIKVRAPDFGDDDDDSDYDDDDVAAIERRLGLTSEDSEDDENEDEDKNGGPSDPERSKKARKEALIKALREDEEMEDLELTNGVDGANSGKGKAKVTDEDEVDDEYEEDSEDEDIKEYVVCTLDPERNYQQPLDITINNDIEMCYFKATGPYKIYLTGNFCIPPDVDSDNQEDEDEEGEEDLEGLDALNSILGKSSTDDLNDSDSDEDEEEDELDDLEDPRVTEVDEEEEEAPRLAKATAAPQKGKNKRPAEEDEDDENDEEDAEMDVGDILKKILKPEEPKEKLSKSQKKKLKNNAGEAVPASSGAEKDKAPATKEVKAKETPNKDSPANGKKVQFAKNLEQGPTPPKSGAPAKPATKNVEGVTIDDRKIGQGKGAKKGDRLQLRYIGKTKDGKQFDANKKGKPFSFKIGDGSVIKGWDIGVQGMTVGGERRIIIPPKLAYGSKSMPGIPANSELTFDMKLIAIN